MSIRRLPAPTSTLLHSSQIVPSFESAVTSVAQNSLQHGARTVRITISPEALRFKVLDDGRGFSPQDWPLALQPGCTSLRRGRGQSLASLAAVASLELHNCAAGFRAVKLLRGGRILDEGNSREGEVPAHPDLEKDGVLVDVWELFYNVPVRRRAETGRHPTLASEATRERVVALSLANPRVAVTLQGGNGLVLYEGGGGKELSEELIQAAFGVEGDMEWNRIQGREKLWFDGFVGKRGYGCSDICLVSVDGVPLNGKGWIHRLIQRIWKGFVALRRADTGAANLKCAAYVVNCKSAGKGSGCGAAHAIYLNNAPPSPEAENEVAMAVRGALQTVDLPQLVARHSYVDPEQISRLASGRKRKSSRIESRFADALVCKRPRKRPSSAWSSAENQVVLRRPLSAASGILAASHRVKRERQQSSRLCIGRPSSAQEVEVACKKVVHGWSNPVYRSKASVSRIASSGHEFKSNTHFMFMKRGVIVQRNSIPKLRIVGQVDRKFIVVVDHKSVMYAVDQHAASERYLYETLLKDVSPRKIRSVMLRPPKRVPLSHKQRATCLRHSTVLLSWGWQVRIMGCGSAEILGAPLIERVNTFLDNEEQLLIYLDSLAMGVVENTTPRPFLNAVASAACHSAVRFGDALTLEQCRSLVLSLSECDSPFLCAHGRPSIVPLTVFDVV